MSEATMAQPKLWQTSNESINDLKRERITANMSRANFTLEQQQQITVDLSFSQKLQFHNFMK